MNAASIRRSSPRFPFFASAFALLAAVTLPACGTRLTPTVAHVSGRAVETVEAGAGSPTVVFESGWGDDWTPWDQVAGLVLVDTRHRDFTAACEEAGLEGCAVPASEVDSLSQVEQAEYRGFARASDEVRDAGAFGPYPVRVLTATSHGFDAQVETLWKSMQASLAHEAADGEQIVFTGAGHYLQIEQAHEVTKVILSLVTTRGASRP